MEIQPKAKGDKKGSVGPFYSSREDRRGDYGKKHKMRVVGRKDEIRG